MNTRMTLGTVNFSGKRITQKVTLLFAALGLMLSLNACSIIEKFQQKDQPEQESGTNAESKNYYYEESSSPRSTRVISPKAVKHLSTSQPTYSDKPKTLPNRKQEAFESVLSDHPTSYTVKKGDTLWDISGRFLSKPWLWPEIWEVNPQIKNPHLIYPGDEVALAYINGKPTMIVSRNGNIVDTLNRGNIRSEFEDYASKNRSINSVRLSPTIREIPLDTAIPTIPSDAIQQFLVYPHVVEESDVVEAPYVLGNYEGRLASAAGHQIYVRGNINNKQSQYRIFRKNQVLIDPDSGESLGYELTHVADAKLLHSGDPATLLITSSKVETVPGDRILSQNQGFIAHNYVPRVPLIEGKGKIISLFNAITRSGRNQVVVINMGKREGVRIGDVMAIEHRGGIIKDSFSGKLHDYIEVPNTRVGVIMVFHTFEKVSYGLIMESTHPIHINDAVSGI